MAGPGDDRVTGAGLAVRRVLEALGRAVAAYTRLEVEGPERLVDPPALIVGNHGFGGLTDLNVLAFSEAFRRLGLGAAVPAVFLTHQLAFTAGLGPLLRPAGFRPAGREPARAGLAEGRYVVVLPGGDADASKTWAHRDEVVFDGRTGFARLAIDAGVPIVPIVAVGAGESLLVLSEGRRLAARLRLDRIVRQKTLPVSIAAPWGLNAGVAALVGYLPLPSKMKVAILDPVRAEPGEEPAALAERVRAAMQAKADELTAGRRPVVG
ncbi:MAG: 1-acyl-sn-glycerol-3-phosphate acyltransferase [Acidimicrobiales bacterium]|nr:1-acyl-sn-glycerol-3-phosphate acyltransferase [Acidimicrobiales bacterium]